jgi:hypothetical protein
MLNATGAVEPSYWLVEGEMLRCAIANVLVISGASLPSSEDATERAYKDLVSLSDEQLLRHVLSFRKEDLAKESDLKAVAKRALTAAFRKFSPKHLNNVVYRYTADTGAIYVMPMESSNGSHQVSLVQMNQSGAAVMTFVLTAKRPMSEMEVIQSFLELQVHTSPR